MCIWRRRPRLTRPKKSRKAPPLKTLVDSQNGSYLRPYRSTSSHFYPRKAACVTNFLGRYEYQLDQKGRVSLPSAFRREGEGGRFVLLQWKAPALTLFPEQVWATTQEKLLQFRRGQPGAWNEVLSITSKAVEVAPDKQGRILIPQWLAEAGGLSGRVLLVGNIDRVELWDPAAFKSALASPSGEFARFADQVFG